MSQRTSTGDMKETHPKKPNQYLRIYYDDRKTLIKIPNTLEEVINAAKSKFRLNAQDDLIAEVKLPDEDEKFEIDCEIWEDLKSSVSRVWIRKDPAQEPLANIPVIPTQVHFQENTPNQSSDSELPNRVLIDVTYQPRTITVKVSPKSRISTVVKAVGPDLGYEPNDLNLRFLADYKVGFERRLNLDKMISYYLEEGPFDILVTRVQIGGKPVIYLSSPSPINAHVTLKLIPEWKFSALYPVAKIEEESEGEQRSSQVVSWDVSVSPDGTLLDKASESEVTYLYWEATTVPCLPARITPPNSRPSSPTSLAFNPAEPDLKPSNAVLVSIDKLPKYLDNALLALCLHTEARTSFITYWLPALLKHTNIALRFLPQSVYEQAAPLDVKPAPTAVLRVFMLWKGVANEEVELWKDASARFEEMPIDEWREVVEAPASFKVPLNTTDKDFKGVKGSDEDNGLTVLEWGGMEVHS